MLRRARLRRLGSVALVLALLKGEPPPTEAANPQPYTVQIHRSGDSGLDTALQSSSTLAALAQSAPVSPFGLLVRARDDRERLKTVLQSFGYYQGSVEIRIAGHALDDPSLLPAMQATPAGQPVPVTVDIDRGPQFHLREIRVTGLSTPSDLAKLNLKSGQPALAADILNAQTKLRSALRDEGYAFAEVGAPQAVVDPEAAAVDVSYAVKLGPHVNLGQIRLLGLQHVDPDYVREHLPLREGQEYNADAIESARQALAAMPIFSSVAVSQAGQLDPEGRLPLDFTFSEAPRHSLSFSGNYSLDLGAALQATWTYNNIFGRGEQLALSFAGTELLGSDARYPGYTANATYTVPDWLTQNQKIQFSVTALQLYLYTYTQTAGILNAIVTRTITPHFTLSYGLQGEEESILQESVRSAFTLLSVPLVAKYDTSDNLFEPTKGLRATAIVTPTESFGGTPGNIGFVLASLQGSTYFDISGNGRSIIALRGLVGDTIGASQFQLPADQRFYAGGSDTVRGYRYQYAGPQFPDGIPMGGVAIDAATLEFRQRIGESYGAVVFLDAAQVAASGGPFQGPVFPGAGVGARYFTSFGPLRVDIAFPLRKVRNDYPIELYLGLGEAF
ncbi:MAG: BamA/TamA family outer membrane protein [Acidobacteriia bacterium]|nr:BamA/TamA family outer membrane protein [Methyloceanibacter sp.]MCL6492652.1 BamA/TamA family outer membrane protein [Terriglobia bacterium]